MRVAQSAPARVWFSVGLFWHCQVPFSEKFLRLLCAPRNVIFQNTFEKRLRARDCGLLFVIEIQVAHAVPVTRGYLKQLHALA